MVSQKAVALHSGMASVPLHAATANAPMRLRPPQSNWMNDGGIPCLGASPMTSPVRLQLEPTITRAMMPKAIDEKNGTD